MLQLLYHFMFQEEKARGEEVGENINGGICHQLCENHEHITIIRGSFIIVAVATLTTTVSFIFFQWNLIRFIMTMTLRMYFCLPITLFTVMEKTIVYYFVFKRRRKIFVLSSIMQQKHQQHQLPEQPEQKRACTKSIVIKLCESTFMISMAYCYLFLIPSIITTFTTTYFQDIDDDIILGWNKEYHTCIYLKLKSLLIGILYLVLMIMVGSYAECVQSATNYVYTYYGKRRMNNIHDNNSGGRYEKCDNQEHIHGEVAYHDDDDGDDDDGMTKGTRTLEMTPIHETTPTTPAIYAIHRDGQTCILSNQQEQYHLCEHDYKYEMQVCRVILSFLLGIAILFFMASLISAWTFLLPHSSSSSQSHQGSVLRINDDEQQQHQHYICDPIDTTECLLPFPSSFFMKEDSATSTGYRVNIDLAAMQTMYKGRKNRKHVSKLNQMDGFSTSGPMLFYMNGFKEGHVKQRLTTSNATTIIQTRLIGPNEMHYSITNQSVTLLLDIKSRELVPHFAEIDYLDEEKPLVIIQPSKVLNHNRQYAVIVIDAIDEYGIKLPISNHLSLLLELNESLSTKEKRRGSFYIDTVLPYLYHAAPFINEENCIQFMFDFHTMSQSSQLDKPIQIIDATLEQLNAQSWTWNDTNVKAIKIIDNDCSEVGEMTSRIIHASINLPHYLKDANSRYSAIDTDALENNTPNGHIPVKVLISTPCSLSLHTKPLRAILDYGHGFLGSRKELIHLSFNQRLSHEQGYIMIASDWKGMTVFDVPMIAKALASDPSLIFNIRDSIIQGFAFKAGIAHFCRSSLLNMDFMKFRKGPINYSSDNSIRMLFYGISQGGILGSAYSTFMGRSKVLDGAALVSGGTPFSTIMSRSIIFPAYQKLMLLNLSGKRSVRIFITIMQMCYDSVEAGGILTITESKDRIPTLIQSGLGDSFVSTVASLILARSYNASIFANTPGDTFGLHSIPANQSVEKSINSVYTKISYEVERNSLSTNNLNSDFNPVHLCIQSDPYAISQLSKFIDTGKFIDPCPQDGCNRISSWARWEENYCI